MNEGTEPKSDDTIPQNAASHEGSLDKEQASAEGRIVVPRGRKLLPSEETLLELGKDLVKDSVTQALEFHKTMLGLTATFATLMASSFTILTLGSKDQPLDSFQRAFLVVPVLLMLVSTICFALGYYPRRVKPRLVLGTKLLGSGALSSNVIAFDSIDGTPALIDSISGKI